MINNSPILTQPQIKLCRTLTEEETDLLLTCLHPDRELASQIYQELREKIIVLFECRNCAFPEDLADETLYRLACEIWAGAQIADIDRYALTVTRSVLKDYPPQSARALSSRDDLLPEQQLKTTEDSERTLAEEKRGRSFLKRCLLALAPEERELLIEYYQGKKRGSSDYHEKMAKRLGMTSKTLKLQIHYLRERLASALNTDLSRS